MTTSRDELISICQQAMRMLRDEFSCTQVQVWKQLEHYGIHVGKTTASKVLNGNGLNVENLPQITKAVQRLVKDTLSLEWLDGHFDFTGREDFKPINIFQTGFGKSDSEFAIHKMGRLNVADKVAFFKEAEHDVVEFGVKLNRFTHNLCKGGYGELKGPIAKLLERGVNFRCYMIDWESQFASLYFQDRELATQGEMEYAREIQGNLQKLLSVKDEFEKQGFPGRFEIYTYKHVPCNYFLIVDGGKEACKMMVSHYIYGIARNKAPVLQFSKKHDPSLYRHYWDSFQALIKTAKKREKPA